MTDANGTPLAVIVSGANQHDINFIEPLIFTKFPRVGGVRGRPPQLPTRVHADCGYTSQALVQRLEMSGIESQIQQRGQPRSNGLGRLRWPVERTISWLKQFRRIGVRRDRKTDTFEAFVTLACAVIAHRQLRL